MPKATIVIADDHALFRAGLRRLIAAEEDMEVVAEAAKGSELVRCLHLKPDVALLDLSMPEQSGRHALRELKVYAPEVRVLIVTMHADRVHLQAAMKEGASGYLTKGAADVELIAAIRTVWRGGIYVDPALESRDLEPVPSAQDPAGGLSARERQVLQLLARGHTNREIGELIGVGTKTVETYRTRLLEKLGLRTRAELVRYALAHEMVAVEGGRRADPQDG